MTVIVIRVQRMLPRSFPNYMILKLFFYLTPGASLAMTGSRGVRERYEYTYEAIVYWTKYLFNYFTFLDRTLQLDDEYRERSGCLKSY